MVLFFWLNVWYSKTILRKGTETQSPLSDAWGLQLQFIPARGRKLCGLRIVTAVIELQFIPARGRRRISVIVHVCEIGNFNFSPQGDGNKREIGFKPEIPKIAIYSRKGMEAYLHLLLFQSLQLQFIPARGRKHCCIVGVSEHFHIAIYPRKGTET